MTTPRAGQIATLLQNGEVLVVGGGSSPASVWAAGSYTPPGASQPQTLTLFWNGTSWATVPGPQPGSTSQLHSVTATPGAAATWVACGYTNTSGATTPLALKNG